VSHNVSPEVEALLTSGPVMAHLATCSNDRPHVAPVWYHYDDGVVEILTTGQKLRNIRENPRVALSIQKDEGGQAEWMVSLLGTATVVEDEEATREAEARINPKYGADPDAWSGNTLVRIEVGSASSRRY
jgi:nitroimidazol reductase NimA-like FMN-containing flavoprotein (pyridoxamine 5'-phosphate oxidase superfamily)